MDRRKKNILVAIVIGVISLGIYLFSVAKFLFSANVP